jgi:hypothetical protein
MKRSLRMLAIATVATSFAAVPIAAIAAPASTEFQVRGFEIAATSTRGTFIGKALGNAGDRGAWRAVIDHTPLSALPARVTGGNFRMATAAPGPDTDFVVGTFTGGTISVLNPGIACTNQIFAVSGSLGGVSTTTSADGSGTFGVVLTHYRLPLFGRCTTFAATVVGGASFTY